ncbi:hypothetical protein QYF36_003669 [Acer negundo]|nr:hypothetical protein QYF36_003669 [Acer negundo]
MSLLDGFSWKSLCVLPNQQPNNNPIQQPNILIQQPTINLRQQPNYNLIQQPNLEQKPIILTDSSSFSFEDDANYNSNGSSYQSTINSDDKVPNDVSEDEIPNENDSVDENDGLSDVNKDDIADEEVVDQPIIGTAFRIGNDGRITLEAIHAFDTICKTDHNTNNVVEAFNGWMNKHRTLPMLTMIETVRKKFMKSILSRYEAAVSGNSLTHPGATSTRLGAASTHLRHASTHAGYATRTSLGGSSTIAASPRISGTVTRII